MVFNQLPPSDDNTAQSVSVSENSCAPMSEHRLHLNEAIRSMLLDQGESDFPPILRTINRHLRQYKLQGRVDAYEVFNEACTRAIQVLESGRKIPNVPAWFRTTSFYVIREWSRKSQRDDQSESIDSEAYQEEIPHGCSALDVLDTLAMHEAYRKLPALDRKVLLMNAEGHSWENIARRLIESGEQSGDVDRVTQNVAQRGHRARQRLRDLCSD